MNYDPDALSRNDTIEVADRGQGWQFELTYEHAIHGPRKLVASKNASARDLATLIEMDRRGRRVE